MNDLSRRRFLHSALGVAAAGAVAGAIAVVPGVASALKLRANGAASRTQVRVAGPVVAHVRDLNSGEISLLVGTSHIIHRDRDLAARIYAAALQTQAR